MNNREKAITDLIERLKELDNEILAQVIDKITETDMYGIVGCNCCVYSDDDNKCCNTCHDSCRNGIKKWLEQE